MDHSRRILRQYRFKTSSIAFVTIDTISLASFFDAGSIFGSDKFVAYGFLEGILVRYSTSGDGQRLPFLIHKTPSGSYTLIASAIQDIVGTTDQFIDATISSGNLLIRGRMISSEAGQGILGVTLTLNAVGGTGPIS